MIDTVIFDLGNVFIPWDPHRLYRKLIADAAHREWFLREICPLSWHAEQDAGRRFSVATEERVAIFPEYEALIRAYYGRWDEMFDTPWAESLALFDAVRATGMRCLALTNWSAEAFAAARPNYPFLELFEGIVVSGEEGVCKPDAEIYRRLFERYAVRPERAVFLDDSFANVEAGRALGLHAVQFLDPAQAREALSALGVLPRLG